MKEKTLDSFKNTSITDDIENNVKREEIMAQEVKNDIKKALQVNTIPLIAIMTAVTTVLTMLVKIPTPIRGYLNLSDTMIYFSAYAFGPWVGGIKIGRAHV